MIIKIDFAYFEKYGHMNSSVVAVRQTPVNIWKNVSSLALNLNGF